MHREFYYLLHGVLFSSSPGPWVSVLFFAFTSVRCHIKPLHLFHCVIPQQPQTKSYFKMVITSEETTTRHNPHYGGFPFVQSYLFKTDSLYMNEWVIIIGTSLHWKDKPRLLVSYSNSAADQAAAVISVIPNAYCRVFKGLLRDGVSFVRGV